MARLFGQLAQSRQTTLLHINPVFDAERYEPRRLSPLVPTIGIRTAADLLAVMPYVEFAAGRRSADDLQKLLEEQASRFCEGRDD